MTTSANGAVTDTPLGRRRGWLTTCEPRRLGIIHLVLVTLAMVAGTALALLIRLFAVEQPSVAMDLLRAHGVVMVFLCFVPAIPSVLGNFFLPPLLGTNSFAFPRLQRSAAWLHAAALVLAVVAIVTGGSGYGWKIFVEFDRRADLSIVWLAASMGAAGASVVAGAVSILATIHKMRPATMSWRELPTLAWGLYAASVVHVVAVPVLFAVLLSVVGEVTLGISAFDPSVGGDVMLFPNLMWLFLHAALVGALVAAMGVIGHLLSVHSGRAPRASAGPWLVGLAVLGLLGWGQHLQSLPVSPLGVLESSVAALLFQAALGGALLGWLRTLRGGSVSLQTPMLYALAFVGHFAIVAPAGLLLALPGVGAPLGGSAFATGYQHYLAFGCVVFAVLGGLHHAWPTVFGRRYDESKARVAFAGLVVGTNLAFFPMLVLGARGVPRVTILDVPGETLLRGACSGGFVLIAVSFLGVAAVLVASLARGERVAGADLGASSEWV
jgi:cytochrome c oxidase subunit 1